MTVEFESYPEIKSYAESVAEPKWFTEMRIKALEAQPALELPNFEKIRYQRWPIQVKKH